MKITNYKDLSNITNLADMIKYTSIDMNAVVTALNGRIDFVDNCDAVLINVTFLASGISYPFNHNLGRIPNGFLVAGLNSNMVLFNGQAQNTDLQIYIQSSSSGSGKVLVF